MTPVDAKLAAILGDAAGDGEPVSKEEVSRRFGGLLELYYVLRPFGADQGQKRV